MATLADKTQHVIVLMLENRSFDHLLGFVPGLGDLDGTESNPSPWGDIKVSDQADYILDVGPDHTHLGIVEQLENGNQGFVASYAATVEKARQDNPNLPADLATYIMRCFATDKIPVLGTLAREFVTFRRWFASVPGETWPNRNYAHASTSHGQVDIKVQPYFDRTIFQLLADNQRSWRIYHDGPAQAWAFPNLWLDFWRHRFKSMDQLFNAIAEDELDHYSFIEPDHGLLPFDKTSNNQHPDNNTPAKEDGRDFQAGEKLIAEVYNSLLAHPDVFGKTLLLVTYDEHGGFYDKVPPPAAVPPDRFIWQKGSASFRFDLFGVRVPTILISPWLDPAVIDTVDYDHSSIVASLRALFAPQAGPLTKRDGVAKTFYDLAARGTPRTNLPQLAPPPMAPDAVHVMAIKARGPAVLGSEPRLDDFQQSLISLTDWVNRQLEAEAKTGARRTRTAARRTRGAAARVPRMRKPGTVRKRFRTHEELATYMQFVTERFHRSVDPFALDLTDAEGRVIEQPDRATVQRAFEQLTVDGEGGRRGKVSLRTANDLVVMADRTGALRRVDLQTGAEQDVRPPAPPTRARAARAAAPDLASAALEAIGRSDLR
jgi:phospholipase C